MVPRSSVVPSTYVNIPSSHRVERDEEAKERAARDFRSLSTGTKCGGGGGGGRGRGTALGVGNGERERGVN